MRRLLAPLSLAAALLLAPSAEAGTVTTSSHTEYVYRVGEYQVTDVRYVAAAGEVNVVSLTYEAGYVLLRDRAGVTPGSGCEATQDRTVARCRGYIGPGQSGISVELGDGDDRLSGTLSATFVKAGSGDDRVEAGLAEEVRGEAGADVLLAPGALLDGGPGPDELVGAAVTYAGRPEPIAADLDGSADDGAPGEGDRIDAGVRHLTGGDGDDRLEGNAADNNLLGGPGDDVLVGGDGRDGLTGELGADELDGGMGDDRLHAGDDRVPAVRPADPAAGTEALSGGPGRDELSGTRGPDVMDGGPDEDELFGYGGGDRLNGVDGALDRLSCSFGPGRSGEAALDRLDLARGCGQLTRTGPGAPRLLVLGITDLDPDGVLRVGVGCSQDQPGGCSVRVRLKRGRRTVVERRARIAPGTARLIRPRLPARLLTRTRDCGRLRFTLTIQGRDTAGRERIIRTPAHVGSTALACRAELLLGIGPDAGW